MAGTIAVFLQSQTVIRVNKNSENYLEYAGRGRQNPKARPAQFFAPGGCSLFDFDGGNHLGTPGAEGGVLGVGAHGGQDLPAALALLALSGGDLHSQRTLALFQGYLGDDEHVFSFRACSRAALTVSRVLMISSQRSIAAWSRA